MGPLLHCSLEVHEYCLGLTTHAASSSASSLHPSILLFPPPFRPSLPSLSRTCFITTSELPHLALSARLRLHQDPSLTLPAICLTSAVRTYHLFTHDRTPPPCPHYPVITFTKIASITSQTAGPSFDVSSDFFPVFRSSTACF